MTGDEVDLRNPALSYAVAFIQKPYAESDLIEAIVEWAVAAPPGSRASKPGEA